MSIFILESDDKFQDLCVVDEQDWMMVNQLDGTVQGESWKPLKVEVYGDNGNHDLDEGDFVDLAGLVPVFSYHAAEKLQPLLKGHGEFLRLECSGFDYVAFNVTRMIDCLNTARSEIIYFSSGRVLAVKQFVLNEERLPESAIFKVPQITIGQVFVTHRFVDLVRECRLRGFSFKPVKVIKGDI